MTSTSSLSAEWSHAGRAIQVLVVEDDPAQALVTAELLLEAFPNGVVMTEARTVEEAEVALARWAPDVVLQDLGLPRVEPIEGVQRVVAAADFAPVIVLTGRSEETLGALAVHCGAQDYLSKGATPPEVLRRSVRYAMERRAASEALHDIESRYRLIVESAQEGVWVLDARGVTTFANGSLAAMLGCSVDDLVGRPISQFLDAEGRATAAMHFQRRRAGRSERFECKMFRRDGSYLYVEVRAAPIMGTTGAFEGATGLVTDITARRNVEDRLRFQAALLDTVGEAVFATDRDGTINFWNDAATQLVGWTAAEATGLDLRALAHPDLSDDERAQILETLADGARWSDEITIRHRSGTAIPVMVSLVPLYDAQSKIVGTIGVAIDLSERRRLEESLAFQALHDELTGLPNRRLFVEHVENSLRRAARTGVRTALLFIDLDDFKVINDRHGHAVADEVLRSVSALLTSTLRDGDIAARLGGDEFVICCNDLSHTDEALIVAERVLSVLRAPFRAGVDTFTVDASVGVALAGHDATADQLLRSADAAMYAAKQGGKQRIELFDDDLHEELRRRRAVATELLSALDAGEIETYFQPEVLFETGEPVAFEALARWTHPTRGPVRPDEFIAIAEESGLIGRLGEYVLRASCDALASWMAVAPDRPVTVAVNVSGRQLTDPAFPDVVRRTLSAAGVPAGRVCLEITESALASHDLALASVIRLKELGVAIAIDDFGTGYSSLSRLQQFPLDYIKIDRSFVSGMTERAEEAAIVSAVVDLARSLGLDTIAEGIETQEQLDALAALGCEVGQGYLWSPAVPAQDALAFLECKGGLARASAVPTAVPRQSDAGDAATHRSREGGIASERSLAILGHELRQPMSVLSASAEMMAESDDPEVIAWSAAAVVRSARRAAAVFDLVDDAVALERGGTLALNSSDLRVADLVSQAVMTAGDRLTGGISLDVGDLRVWGDLERLVSVLTNLFVNCSKHAPGSPVEVTASHREGYVRISVRDHGPGVAPDSVGAIFKKFGRGSTPAPGSGLGLFVARGIVRAHGGHLRYRPAEGGGAQFTLEIPAPAATAHHENEVATSPHGVYFYRDFHQVAETIAAQLASAAAWGHAVVVLATPDHRRSMEVRLGDTDLLGSDRYVALDAETVLAAITCGGEVDPAGFEEHVGRLVRVLSSTFGGVVVFGELVDLLWKEQRPATTRRLEELWNELSLTTSFALACGYDAAGFSSVADMGTLAALHSHVHAEGTLTKRAGLVGPQLRERADT